MTIRNKILIYFSSTVIVLSAISLIIIYILFSEYREEQFQQLQKDKVRYTIKLIIEYKQMSEELASIMDELTIHDFYDEKMLVFDSKKDLIFSSIDDLQIESYGHILNELSPAKQWIETKEGEYDIVGVYLENNEKSYYAISKAFDAVGYSKMYFLRNVLIVLFTAIVVAVSFVAHFLSNRISKPLTKLAEKLGTLDLSGELTPELKPETSSYELELLTERFNQLSRRTNEAFAFQKHTIQHISHELKTPIAILVSELEKLKDYSDVAKIKTELDHQINKAKALGDIIKALLEISKIESGQKIYSENIRLDELIFDIIQELNSIHPDFNFEVNYEPEDIDENTLALKANSMLIKQAFQNLLANCIAYSDNKKAEIKIDCTNPEKLKISVINSGKTLSKEEAKYLFDHFFRGENSRGKTGFGLGLVLAKKIFAFSNGSISYSSTLPNENAFNIVFSAS